jgi:endonuclease/exonuclease/phosphatase family metal-dependent hydrolase
VPVTVLSWNIQNLGASKVPMGPVAPGRREILDVIRQVITGAAADVVGIMEVQSGLGPWLSDEMCAQLNNVRPVGAAYTWRGMVSARQDGGTDEEYLYLWKDEPGVLTLDPAGRPGPTSTVAMVDQQALAGFAARVPLTDAQLDQLILALQASGYIFRSGTAASNLVRPRPMRLSPRRWGEMDAAGANAAVTFAAPPAAQPPALTLAQRQDLARVLLDVDILRFLKLTERSPYLANFLVGNPARPLLVALYHTLGPSDRDRFSAINVCALSRPMAAAAAAGNLLLMGDFNIALANMGKRCLVYTRTNDGTTWFTPVRPAEMAQVFAPIVGAPLNAPDLIGPQETSVSPYYWPATEPYTSMVVNEYDKFFFHPAAANPLVAQAARVLDVLPQLSSTTVPPNPNLARSALTYYRAFRGLPFVDADRARLQGEVTEYQANVDYWTAQAAGAQAEVQATYGGAPAPPRSILGKRERDYTDELARAQADLNGINTEMGDLMAFRGMVANAALPAVAGSGPALNVYRDALSDHLPIVVTLA